MLRDGIDPARYREFIGEKAEVASYIKSTYYKPLGYPEGIYRVGPLALGRRHGSPFLGRDLMEDRNYSEDVAKAIDEEVHRIMDSGYQRARQILEDARTIPFAQMSPGSIKPELQAMPGLADASGASPAGGTGSAR